MLEYGQMVGQGSGAGGSGGGGGSIEVAADIAAAASDAVARVAALPPQTLFVIAAVILGGLFVFRPAF